MDVNCDDAAVVCTRTSTHAKKKKGRGITYRVKKERGRRRRRMISSRNILARNNAVE
jgi:hypothetical protein